MDLVELTGLVSLMLALVLAAVVGTGMWSFRTELTHMFTADP